MTIPFFPILFVDLVGSACMVFFAVACVRLSYRLYVQDRENVLYLYLLMVSHALAVFAFSRSIGHIAKQLLLLGGHRPIWEALRPYSGSLNTISFCVVGAVTLFFERIWKVHQQILRDRQALQKAHERLVWLNQRLQQLVSERTAELGRSEQKFRRIFEASRDMIAVVAENGTVLDMNPAGRQMLGIDDIGGAPEMETPSLSFRTFFLRPQDWNTLKERVSRESYVTDAEVELISRDGREISALLSAASQCDLQERAELIYLVAKDITQRKVIQQQLLQADKLASIGQLAAGVAHEINNPLGIILGYTQLLMREEHQGTERYEDLKTIEKHARTCKAIVEDLLSFARSAHTRKEPVLVQDLVQEVLGVVRHNLELKHIQVITHFEASVPEVVVDRNKMRQVFMNLIMNAQQAIGSDGRIEICTSLAENGHMAEIAVSDTGTGIDPKHLPRIFDPFFTTKSTGEGTGLGLSVSYGIVKDHGGEILVASELGKGSVFTVRLPVPSEKLEWMACEV
ncbi:two-component system sensor histidine kinase NtrB [Desulfosoma caldarium]|uniref:histidine kinase n=1 Tax=Desulfosoma caldarium TaxID=610254 RepID=A0A3N1UHJ9_9BACT|nr:ATP-binding protein [Desulfosoma caldarium]ROQ90742.1 PAS domain S-box-containing protein [Desulfosoma caldarium]